MLLDARLCSLVDVLVKSECVNSKLDRFWIDQEVKYNWKADD